MNRLRGIALDTAVRLIVAALFYLPVLRIVIETPFLLRLPGLAFLLVVPFCFLQAVAARFDV